MCTDALLHYCIDAPTDLHRYRRFNLVQHWSLVHPAVRAWVAASVREIGEEGWEGAGDGRMEGDGNRL